MPPRYIDMNIWIGGKFIFDKGRTDYVGGINYLKKCVWLTELNVDSVRGHVITAMKVLTGKIAPDFSIWYKRFGLNLSSGREIIDCPTDMDGLINSRDINDRVTIWATDNLITRVVLPKTNPKAPSKPNLTSIECETPRRKSISLGKLKELKKKGRGKVHNKGKVKGQRKSKGESGKVIDGVVDGEDWSDAGEWSSDSEYSDLEVQFEQGEEDKKQQEEDEIFVEPKGVDFLEQIKVSLGGMGNNSGVQQKTRYENKESGGEHNGAGCEQRKEDGVDIGNVAEVDYDSEELRSLQGSDDEIDCIPKFNPETDFKRNIQLTRGLKFPNVYVLRKAIRYHSIENHYDYYYLHNGRARITVHCV